MLNLQSDYLRSVPISMATTWLLTRCAEARGTQQLRPRVAPAMLDALREQALIQSVESSNRIEGVTVDADRLKPLVLGRARPRDRSEEELAGYRRALDWIFSRSTRAEISPKTILHLHALAQGGMSGDAGQWKTRDNEIVEFSARGERRIRFRALSAKATPAAMKRLCSNYAELQESTEFPDLILIATFVFDFLCIHPFRDGNGRVSRLLTALLLDRLGYSVCRYVSLEKLIEESKESYYAVLHECSQGWHEGRNPIVPWWNYFLTQLKDAYALFEERMVSAPSGSKTEIVRRAIEERTGEFTLADLRAECPTVSPQMIKNVLQQFKSAGKLQSIGKGRGARWNRP